MTEYITRTSLLTANATLPPRISGGDTTAQQVWADEVAAVLDGPGAVHLPFGTYDATPEDRKRAVLDAFADVRDALIRRGAPDVVLEVDEVQVTVIVPGFTHRTLLPHHDGGHRSYLTPSLLAAPNWSPDLRRFSSTGYNTTDKHKLYQGLYVEKAGVGVSRTPYYPWMQIIRDAYRLRHGASSGSTSDVQAWLGRNIKYSLSLQEAHGSRYLSVAAALGAEEPAYHVTPPGPRGESDLSDEQYLAMPGLRALTDSCVCGTCDGPGMRHFCNGLQKTLGVSWSGFRDKYEQVVETRSGDAIMGNNLALLHAGDRAVSERLLLPLCMVSDEAEGPAYEAWLNTQWSSLDAPIDELLGS